MPTFQRCEPHVDDLARDLIKKFDDHKPLIVAGVKIDYVFAYADLDEKTGQPCNDALTLHGHRALGITRKIALKDRALDRGDAEISLDGDWWKGATAEEQAALVDHELHHIEVKHDKHGNIQFDDLGRPQIKLRKHDVEIGWFKCIAERHGAHSIERQQAKAIMDEAGQFFWPELAPKQIEQGTVTLKTGGKSVTVTHDQFTKATAKIIKGSKNK